jgi:sarcosine oxidase
VAYDAIVVGVGGMGSAALYHLARRGASVLGLEQFDIPHERGSSHGVSRIIRLAYAEHADYVPLLRRAYALWRALEGVAGEPLLLSTGGLDIGAPESATVRGSMHSCAVHHLEHEVLDAASVFRRHPGCRLPSDMIAVYQPDAGFLLPERCIVAHVEAARKMGATVQTGDRVVGWTCDAGGVRVHTERAAHEAKRLVLTAGAWVRTLVPQLHDLAVPERQVLIWTAPLQPDFFRLGSFPVFNMEAPEGRFYGFPVYGVPGFKIGKYHHRREAVDPDAMDRGCHAEDEAVLRAGIRRYFPDADGPTIDMKACLFTNSPDEHFIIDFHPEHRAVAIAAGFSGHGFKFCSVVGELMADLALEGRTRHDIGLFRLDRFARRGPTN